MLPTELQTTLTELYDAFPHLKRRLMESPRVLKEWTQALRPLSFDSVSHAISRWIRHHNTDPTLDQFLDLLDTMVEERQRWVAGRRDPGTMTDASDTLTDVLHNATLGAQNDDDRAWARFHEGLFVKGLAKDTPEARKERAALYEIFAEEYPSLAVLARQAAEECTLGQ